jgi:hypothetical protein
VKTLTVNDASPQPQTAIVTASLPLAVANALFQDASRHQSGMGRAILRALAASTYGPYACLIGQQLSKEAEA